MSEKKTPLVLKHVPNIVVLNKNLGRIKVPCFEVLTCWSKYVTFKTHLKTLVQITYSVLVFQDFVMCFTTLDIAMQRISANV